MQQHEKFFLIPYDDEEIINDRIIDFFIDHIAKLESNNGNHQFDSMILTSKTVLNDLQAKSTGKLEGLSDQVASTISVVVYLSQYKILVKRAIGNVTSLYPKGTPEFSEFFVKPVKYYTSPRRPKIGENIDHFIARFTAHSELGTAVKDDFVTLKAAFDPARNTQVHNIGAVHALILNTSVERQAVNEQLFDNLLSIVKLHKGHPEYAKVFFSPSKLYKHSIGQDDTSPDEEFSVITAGNETKNSGLTNIVGKTARFVSLKGRMQIYRVLSLDDLEPGTEFLTLEDEGDVTIPLAQIGDDNAPYLIVRNLDSEESEVVIEWVD